MLSQEAQTKNIIAKHNRMTQITTASQLLAQIENDFFAGAGLAEACLTKGEERRAYKLAQVERLLTERHGSSELGMWLSDIFWTADEGRVPAKIPNPLMMPGQPPLTDDEKNRLRLIVEVAGLCHDLCLHFTFDLKQAFGVVNNFSVSNKRLVEWLYTTKHERIAMHTAYIMKKQATGMYARCHYLPAQDELAELYSVEHNCLVGNPDNTKMPPREYINKVIEAMLQIERHWKQGRRRKLNAEVVILHDEICGMVPERFSSEVLKAAQALFDYMDNEVKGRGATAEVMDGFAGKVSQVRAQYLANGWLADDSLAFGYLMAHAERCAQGSWGGEDDL